MLLAFQILLAVMFASRAIGELMAALAQDQAALAAKFALRYQSRNDNSGVARLASFVMACVWVAPLWWPWRSGR